MCSTKAECKTSLGHKFSFSGKRLSVLEEVGFRVFKSDLSQGPSTHKRTHFLLVGLCKPKGSGEPVLFHRNPAVSSVCFSMKIHIILQSHRQNVVGWLVELTVGGLVIFCVLLLKHRLWLLRRWCVCACLSVGAPVNVRVCVMVGMCLSV